MLNLHNFIDHIRHEERMPEVIAERCVHSNVEIASCLSCADICPTNAWSLDDHALLIDTSVCDGCGLCASTCPEGAIQSRQEILIGEWNSTPIALCACEKNNLPRHQGIISCIHIVTIQDILSLYHKGIRTWKVATADCDNCQRGCAEYLSKKLASINRSLSNVNRIGVTHHRLNIIEWQRIREGLIEKNAGPTLSRRGFLRGVVNAGLQCSTSTIKLFHQSQETFSPPGKLLPNRGASSLWPFQPVIDPSKCNGCDACTRLCPHQAIRLQVIEENTSYKLIPESCSGCGICIDVCEQEAVRVTEWEKQKQLEVRLRRNICSSCGNPFHLPIESAAGTDIQCRICEQTNHHKNLYQVLS